MSCSDNIFELRRRSLKFSIQQSLVARCAAVFAASVVCMGAAQAQEVKVGFVSTERIFREAAPAKTANAKIEQGLTPELASP